MRTDENHLRYLGKPSDQQLVWEGPENSLVFDREGLSNTLLNLDQPCFAVRKEGRIGLTNEGKLRGMDSGSDEALALLSYLPLTPAETLGDHEFREFHGCRYAYYAGSMAHGISSAELVIALGKKGFLASFGAGGIPPAELEGTIQRIQQELPRGPYAFNLIHNPFAENLEKMAAEVYLKYGVQTVEASAFMDLTPHIVYYRVAGLSLNPESGIEIGNKVIAKVSRREVATKFMEPAPDKYLSLLLEQNLISEAQARMARKVPMADDVTVEADSGGHTDNRPLVSLLPSIIALRNEIQQKYGYRQQVRVGAAGGIGTPESVLAAFMMGAAYVATGSVNQACLEAGTSDYVRNLLLQVGMADVCMAPAFDMFEMGGKLQVVKRGTLFPMRAKKLNELYLSYKSIEEIPTAERDKLEKQIFQRSLDSVWEETMAYFNARDPEQIKRALANPRKKMALIFRWYLGLTSHWANSGEIDKEMDYQVWCGPSMGAFNDWVRGSYLEKPEQRRVTDVAHHLMNGAAYLFRLQQFKFQQLIFPTQFNSYKPSSRL
ncbi:MAG: PfaD family polyunsaturated fatty acid/polyketide biosynthesis protein [Deltaproteobacteria bacterium]|jgi:trans-AT polyketide synthase, acyltransferase and oxidoreductase domains|nr:PfaD family polyunsaturated fatty acid/polyketide biosynthesis protein [Deltaproteobacteria bacterium]MBT4640474.1 PfaD family polyunsaturated fatty acid/polyketide biosynthesis protein [Deltaproteobacteria bacterium]MBT6502932.1 PfaD family polyunsaturated fatty acid/polyketide biosynthesis protein [Deltaproteobacteria bacterium]MBT7154435.1 PfaD family polyunsaturated fatty acid/polyketide biosynthesis protein [Deltaproteobacteria bacterium]MBT7710431.1 PfaD family polyunsaturated fatty ac